MNKQQSGFTLIELVVVIVLLGILAVTALPKYTNIQKDAKVAVLNSVGATIREASMLVHAKSMIQGTASAADGNVKLPDGAGGEMNIKTIYGYPIGTKANAGIKGIQAVVSLDESKVKWAPFAKNKTSRDVGYKASNATDKSKDCSVTYTQPDAFVGAQPKISYNTDGC